RIRGDFGRATDLAVAPAGGDRVAIANHRHEIWFVDGKTGRSRRLGHSPASRVHGMAWSPDGRWLAYALSPSHASTCLYLHDVKRRRTHQITRPDFHDYAPSFDPGGKFLYFLSARVFDPVYDQHYFDLGFPNGVTPCLIPLAKTTPDPFRAAHREPKAPAAEEEEGDDKKKSKKPAPVIIDLPGIEDRIVTLPVYESRFERVVGAKGRIFFTDGFALGSLDPAEGPPPPALATLRAYDFEQDKILTFKNTVSDIEVTADGKTLLIRAGNELRVIPASIEPKDLSADEVYSRATGWVDLDRLRTAVEPGAEWRQMFREAWRLQRDHFWTEDMSHVDWHAVHDRYLPLVDRAASRLEFSDLMWEMQGELGTSHCYELGGDYAPGRRWHQGFLGADLVFGGRPRRWRIAHIPRGDSWSRSAASPLAAPSLDVRVGDEIVSVAGQKVSATRSPQSCLVNTAEATVQLVVRRKSRKARTIAIETLADERALRYRDWVEANRARVHKATRGRVGYVHIPDMGPRGFSEFHRYYRGEVERNALIVDVRWNGGGHVSQLLLEKLVRRRVGYDFTRYNGVEPYPLDAPFGPMVALTNEYAGSDGDMFSHAWKLYGLGPLIGKRTWGGVVGIWPRHALVDGTVTTQPEFAFWFEDVGYGVENYGTDPDIEVTIKPQDHKAGRDTQLDRGLTEIRRLLKENPPKLPDLAKKQPNLKPPRLPRA
ncbi:MAG: PDZ domain-containing protein, partial [Planctomycetota bacterium]|nr:PDZ domain-containing protein [Planctomycetota bacterium]